MSILVDFEEKYTSTKIYTVGTMVLYLWITVFFAKNSALYDGLSNGWRKFKTTEFVLDWNTLSSC